MNRFRPGISILELLVVMSASSVVLTLAGMLIIRAMHTQMDSRTDCDVERNALRLAEQFRRDVHDAERAEANPQAKEGASFLGLQFSGGNRVEYSRAAGAIQRVASMRDGRVSREEFKFPAAAQMQVDRWESPPRMALTILSPPPSETMDDKPSISTRTVPVSVNLEAVLGRDRQMAAAHVEGDNR
jgi:hypothetical protein